MYFFNIVEVIDQMTVNILFFILESLSPVSGTSCDEIDDHFGNRRKQKRGVLPKYATSIMRSWLFQHLVVGLIILTR